MPILTTSTFIMFGIIAVRIWIANALELTFILYIATTDNFFHTFDLQLVSIVFLTFNSYSLFKIVIFKIIYIITIVIIICTGDG